jgi:hypothetical protein
MPSIGRTKYSIIPFVSGWLMSKRYSSPSQTTSMPACSCVPMTTRVASTSACSEGAATSQSGTGYEPTTVVWMRGVDDGMALGKAQMKIGGGFVHRTVSALIVGRPNGQVNSGRSMSKPRPGRVDAPKPADYSNSLPG